MRIGIYARVSTKDQSCELQVRDLRSYCVARGFDLVRANMSMWANQALKIHAPN